MMEQKLIRHTILLEFQPKNSICFISKGRLENIPIAGIIHIQKCGAETVIHTSNLEYKTYHSLQELLNELPVNEFARIHRSHIISLQAVSAVDDEHIYIKGHILPMSGYYKEQLKRKLGAILEHGYAWFRER